MSITMDEEIKRWTARRKSALVLEIIRGKTTVSEASRQFDLAPSEIEDWIEQGKAGMENALRAKPEHKYVHASGVVAGILPVLAQYCPACCFYARIIQKLKQDLKAPLN
jgi:hypothetical protein